MRKQTQLILLLLFLSSSCVQVKWNKSLPQGGEMAIFQGRYAPFPHLSKIRGHQYDGTVYSYANHYSDSSVAIYIPCSFKPTDSVDLVFYFHGWNNNIMKAIHEFELIEQFSKSNRNAIFVFPEGPKNTPDSSGGKLEDKNKFKKLTHEVIKILLKEKKIYSTTIDDIILAGHSGAYRAMAFILDRGGLTEKISEVYLFDGLYGMEGVYLDWLKTYKGKFINIITPKGGTLSNSQDFINRLSYLNIPFYKHEDNNISCSILTSKKVVFIFSSLDHNEVLNPYFQLFLESSNLDMIIKLNNFYH